VMTTSSPALAFDTSSLSRALDSLMLTIM
jgi:hypothetical protein